MMLLEGIRILDWTVAQQGSGATALLGSLGAEVIKIEERGRGEAWRAPSLKIASVMDAGLGHGRNYYFETMNCNKKSLALDLKKEAGRRIIYRLVEKSDAFVTNYRKSVAARLGIDYQSIAKYNPDIIYARASGLGVNGPYADRPAFDYIAQARTGIMYLGEKTPPLLFNLGIADQAGAILLAFAVLAGLFGQKRHKVGQEVDVSLLGSMMYLQSLDVVSALFTGKGVPRENRTEVANPLINSYKCRDGKWIMMGLGPWSEKGWSAFCHILGIPEILRDPRFETRDKRQENNRELIGILDRAFATRPREEWISLLEKEDALVFGPLNDVSDLPNDAQVLENRYIVDYRHPVLGDIKVLGSPFQFSKAETGQRLPAPELGEHNGQILAEILGYSEQQIRELKEQEVI